jgi:phytoene dehydrogenase-like protein
MDGGATMPESYDAIVVGSGPNGLSAAVTLARAGRHVLVVEARETIGGGARSAELTLPGFVHDVCSAIHPLAAASPFFRSLPLGGFGLEFIHPATPLAHPLPGGRAAVMRRSVEATAQGLGADGTAYERVFRPLAREADRIFDDLLGPLPIPPRHPFTLARFGWNAAPSASGFWRRRFVSEEARALFAGNAAHAWLPLGRPFTAAVGLMLHLSCHHAGWPVVRGGSQRIADALGGCLRSHGGEIRTGWRIERLDELPPARAVFFDTNPQAMARIAGRRLPDRYRRRLEQYRFGPGAFKIDLALGAPIPWTNPDCRTAGTVHLGGTAEDIAFAEAAIWRGDVPARPYTLVAQQSLCDATRAPSGRHTAWIYAHVPHGCTADLRESLLDHVEGYAPGFRDTILASHVTSPRDFESYNPNLVGGDIIGGVQDIRQMFTRPVARWNPYTTPARDIFICSASTPPGAGVHGMCGYHAARAALDRVFS